MKRVGLGSIGGWLGDGFRLFGRSSTASIGYAAIFVLLGLVLEYWLLAAGYGLYYFVLAGGFVLVAPFLFAPYYRLASDALQGRPIPGTAGLIKALFRAPLAVWVVGIVCGALFLIWATDAFIIYSVYFGFQPLPELFTGGATSSAALTFISYASLLGLVLSVINLFVTAYSIPRVIHQGSRLVDAIVFSTATVGRNFGVVMLWGVTLAVCMLLVLLLALPLGLVVFPVLVYANFFSYRELAGLQEIN